MPRTTATDRYRAHAAKAADALAASNAATTPNAMAAAAKALESAACQMRRAAKALA